MVPSYVSKTSISIGIRHKYTYTDSHFIIYNCFTFIFRLLKYSHCMKRRLKTTNNRQKQIVLRQQLEASGWVTTTIKSCRAATILLFLAASKAKLASFWFVRKVRLTRSASIRPRDTCSGRGLFFLILGECMLLPVGKDGVGSFNIDSYTCRR